MGGKHGGKGARSRRAAKQAEESNLPSRKEGALAAREEGVGRPRVRGWELDEMPLTVTVANDVHAAFVGAAPVQLATPPSRLSCHTAAGLKVRPFSAVDAASHATKRAMARANGLPDVMCLNPECGTCHVRHAAVYLSHVLLLREIACSERARRAWSLIVEDDARVNERVSAAQLRAFLAHETASDIVFFNRGNCQPGGVLHCGYGLYGYAVRRAAAISLAVYLTPGSPFLSTNAERDADAKPCLIDWEMCRAIEHLGLVATCPPWTVEHGEWIEVDPVEQAKSTVSCRGANSIAVGCLDGAEESATTKLPPR